MVMVTGVAKGAPEIRATLKETGEPIARMGVSVKPRLDMLVLIHAITETNQNLVPTMVPTEVELEDYLNDTTWGKQANVYFTVLRTDYRMAYDLNANGICDGNNTATPGFSSEEMAIMQGAGDTNVAINVYYVASYGVSGNSVNASTYKMQVFIQDSHLNSAINITAHEIGHALGNQPESASSRDLMFFTSSPNNPCRITKFNWDNVNR
jgi:hypothetical protein